MEVRNLEPQPLWSRFCALNAIPRASKREAQVIAFMKKFGEDLGLETVVDRAGNVVIKKPATPGMERRQTVILQSHLDMVHQKNSDTLFDFDQQGIEMFVEGDWVKARGTTLGADNGIGVAAIMAVLAAGDLVHPALEAMFTIDEETGMTGAKALDPQHFSGTILLNLDTEEDDELTIGCAGGIDTNTAYRYPEVPVMTEGIAFNIHIKGLSGGHSGMDIHKGRANANKLMNRFLYSILEAMELQLASLNGGSLRNAIPRESEAVVVVPAAQKLEFLAMGGILTSIFKEEYQRIEPQLQVVVTEVEGVTKAMDSTTLRKVVNAIYAMPNGVYRMSPDIDDLVEASTNLARVIVKDGEFITQSLQRSSVESSKTDVAQAVGAALLNMGCEVSRQGDYPGWKPDPESAILTLMRQSYEQLFQQQPQVAACHAGLECGIIAGHLPKLDMISFGPTIHGAHSPDERVKISSVQKFWTYLNAVLAKIPEKQAEL